MKSRDALKDGKFNIEQFFTDGNVFLSTQNQVINALVFSSFPRNWE